MPAITTPYQSASNMVYRSQPAVEELTKRAVRVKCPTVCVCPPLPPQAVAPVAGTLGGLAGLAVIGVSARVYHKSRKAKQRLRDAEINANSTPLPQSEGSVQRPSPARVRPPRNQSIPLEDLPPPPYQASPSSSSAANQPTQNRRARSTSLSRAARKLKP
jgi:hypothetical protein